MTTEFLRLTTAKVRFAALSLVLGLNACGGGGGPPPALTDADRLTQALSGNITVGSVAAERVRGTPPTATAATNRPSIAASSVAARPGEIATVVVDIESAQPAARLFARVPGASSYFRAALPPQATGKHGAVLQAKLSSSAQVRIAVPADRTNGELICFDFSVEDSAALLSDTAQACIKVQTGNFAVGPTVIGSAAGASGPQGDFRDVAVVGERAYVADFASQLSVFDVSDRQRPTLIGVLDLPPCCPKALAVAGGYAYVATLSAGLQIVDVDTNPTAPTIVGALATAGGQAEDVAVAGNRAYVIDYNSGLIVADISNPALPTALGTLSFSSSKANAIAVNGDRAYVATVGAESSIFYIVDISNPAAPSVLGQLALPLGVQAIAVQDNRVYIHVNRGNGDGQAVVFAIDVANPAMPTILDALAIAGYDSSTEVPDDFFFRGKVGIATAGDTVLATSGSGTYLIDASNPGALALLGSVNAGADGVDVRGDLAFVGGGRQLDIIDFSNPVSPRVVADATAQLTFGASVAGTYAFLTGASGLEVLDLGDPSAPSRLSSLADFRNLRGNAIAGNLLYAAAANSSASGNPSNAGLRIVDISDPAAPRFIGGAVGASAAGGFNDPIDVAVSGNRAYVADGGESAITIVDVDNPAAPVVVGKVSVSAPPLRLFVSGDLLFSAGVEDTQILDITNRSSPQVRGKITGASAVVVAGDRAYAAGRDGVQVVDISDTTHPQPIGQVQAPTVGAADIVKAGDLVYAGPGLAIVDVSEPEQPVLLASPATGQPATSLAVDGRYAYFATLRLGFNVMDLGVYAAP
ncbi:MAG TPA: hypothetical protein VGE51_13105 [Fontimonas sp.]